jgi:hypothetical protein
VAELADGRLLRNTARLYKEAQDANRVKDDFRATPSHEIADATQSS